MRHLLLAAAGVLMLASAPAQAAEVASTTQCAVHYTRTACPGQEDTSFKKCDGQASWPGQAVRV